MFNSSYFFKSLLVMSLLLVSTIRIYAQYDEPVELEQRKNNFKISPQSLVVSTFLISYERYLGKGTTFQLSGGLMAAEKENSNSNYNYSSGTYIYTKDRDKASGYQIEGLMKFYFLKGSYMMSGFYAGPYARYSNNRFQVHSSVNQLGVIMPTLVDYRIETYEAGAVFGYQFVIGGAFVMDLFAGGGIKSSDNTSPATYTSTSFDILEQQDYSGVVPRAGFRLGFAF